MALAVMCIILVAAWLWMVYSEEQVNKEDQQKEELS